MTIKEAKSHMKPDEKWSRENIMFTTMLKSLTKLHGFTLYFTRPELGTRIEMIELRNHIETVVPNATLVKKSGR
jgi:hypothetical protein